MATCLILAPLCFLGFGFFGRAGACGLRKGNRPRQAHQHVGQLHGGQVVEDGPFVLGDGDHHPPVGHLDLVGHVVARDLLRDHGLAMHRPQRRLERAQHVVRHQRHAEGEQGGLGITQRVDLAVERRLQLLERRLDRPAAPVQIGEDLGAGVLGRHVGQQVEFGVPVPRRLAQEHRDPPQVRGSRPRRSWPGSSARRPCRSRSGRTPAACRRTPSGASRRVVESRTKPFHDAPFDNPPQSLPEEVEVTDPTHPLFGRRFPVISVTRQARKTAMVFVAYRESMRLRIPVSSTESRTGPGSALPAQNGPGKPSASFFPWSPRVTRHATAPRHLAGTP